MHCHSSSGQSYRLVVSENDGRRHNSEMEPQGRTIASPSRTRRQSKTLCLEKTALRVRNYVQTVGLNAETKKDRHRAAGEIFVLTFPLIGLTGFATLLANRDARTEVTSFQVYNFKVRAQIGTSNVEN